MSEFKLLLVEDNDAEIGVFKESVEIYKTRNSREIKYHICKSVDEAYGILDNSFDGAIIDLKLPSGDDEGNKVVEKIKDSFRIPVAIFTGTPDAADSYSDFNYVGIFKKGEKSYSDILDKLLKIYATGLTRIVGGRGKIEETLNKVFNTNLIPQINKWVEYGENDSAGQTETGLLRYTLNHLLQLLDNDGVRYYPEEVYIAPSLAENIQTGSIVSSKDKKSFFVVMSPACDLALGKNECFKTKRILLVEIEKMDILEKTIETKKVTKSDKQEKMKEEFYKNNYTFYYHFLPKTDFFPGGFINFRNINTYTKEEFDNKFINTNIQIIPYFVRDIQGRLSSYYARQGQPDIDLKKIV